MKKVALLAALGLSGIYAGGGDAFEEDEDVEGHHWDYGENGESWGAMVSKDCLLPNQSPIDLHAPKEVLAKKSYPIVSSEVDKIMKNYSNVKKQEVHWNGHTSQANIHNAGVYNRFIKKITNNKYQNNAYYDGPTEFNAIQFHFHSGSEHTIDGYRYDLEMHTVHEAKADQAGRGGISHAAVGIMFDVKYYSARLSWAEQKVIDNFFDSMKWEDLKGNPVVDVVNYGVLMGMVDFNNRYTYKGSVTTPPCARFVHWNLLSTVYPISEKHLKLFKKQLERNTVQEPKLSVTGNWRKTQPINTHDIKYVRSATPTKSNEFYALDQSGELYLLEGAKDKKWLNEQEAKKYRLEQVKPGQYQYVAKKGAKVDKPATLPTLNLPTISLNNAAKLAASLAVSASIVMGTI